DYGPSDWAAQSGAAKSQFAYPGLVVSTGLGDGCGQYGGHLVIGWLQHHHFSGRPGKYPLRTLRSSSGRWQHPLAYAHLHYRTAAQAGHTAGGRVEHDWGASGFWRNFPVDWRRAIWKHDGTGLLSVRAGIQQLQIWCCGGGWSRDDCADRCVDAHPVSVLPNHNVTWEEP